MSTLSRIVKKCALCGCEREYTVIMSTNAFGSMDLDTRPPEMKRSLLPYEIQYCKHCHYANYDIDEVIEGLDARLLQTSPYLAVVNNADIDETPKSYLLAAHLYSKSGDHHSAGFCFLRAAWAFDDAGRNDYAIRARKKSLQSLIQHVEDTGDMDAAVLTVDLQRRIADFDGAVETADQLLNYGTESDFLDKILMLEKKLCAQRDSDCHNVGEVE